MGRWKQVDQLCIHGAVACTHGQELQSTKDTKLFNTDQKLLMAALEVLTGKALMQFIMKSRPSPNNTLDKPNLALL